MTNSSDVIIREAHAGDELPWRELFLAYGVFYDTSFTEDITRGVWAWILDPSHPLTCWVAEDNGVVVGFAHVREQPDTFRAGPSWFLDDLFTAPAARGRGVGRALIAHATDFAKRHGGGDLRWITAEDNAVARGLYDTLATQTSWVMYELDTERGI